MAETWVLNERLNLTGNASYIGTFTCDGTTYAGIRTTTSVVTYLFNTTQMGGQRAYTQYGWDNETYRTIVFDESPSGTLLTWLQRNGTKQVDPEPTTPKNACLIDGTGYSIKQGKVLIDGTAYTIKKGRTLNGGTGYDIKIAEDSIMITVVGGDTKAGSRARAYVIYNGQNYTDTTFEVQPGETVQVYLSARSGSSMSYIRNQSISLNGTVVAKGLRSNILTYDYTPTKSATITIDMTTNRPGGTPLYSTAAIVEEG